MAHFPSLFKTKSHKKFEFKPRYYNPDKEALEQRINMIKAEVREEKNNPHLRIKLQEEWRKNSRTQANRRSNLRIVVIAGLLAIITYFYLFV